MYFTFHLNSNSRNDEIHIYEDDDDKPLCNDKNVVKGSLIKGVKDGKYIRSFNENQTRIFAASLQNHSRNVCGVCVSRLYKTK